MCWPGRHTGITREEMWTGWSSRSRSRSWYSLLVSLHSTVQYSTVQYSTVQYSTVQYCTCCIRGGSRCWPLSSPDPQPRPGPGWGPPGPAAPLRAARPAPGKLQTIIYGWITIPPLFSNISSTNFLPLFCYDSSTKKVTMFPLNGNKSSTILQYFTTNQPLKRNESSTK